MKTLASIAKAIGGGLLAGLVTLSAVASNAHGPADVTFSQWVFVAISFVGVGLGVWKIPNYIPPVPPTSPTDPTP